MIHQSASSCTVAPVPTMLVIFASLSSLVWKIKITGRPETLFNVHLINEANWSTRNEDMRQITDSKADQSNNLLANFYLSRPCTHINHGSAHIFVMGNCCICFCCWGSCCSCLYFCIGCLYCNGCWLCCVYMYVLFALAVLPVTLMSLYLFLLYLFLLIVLVSLQLIKLSWVEYFFLIIYRALEKYGIIVSLIYTIFYIYIVLQI